MKLQYLGDSKDSFKWDYHDYLMTALGYPVFNIALMMTPDDGGNDGKTKPTAFPARKSIIDFCHHLRDSRSLPGIQTLPHHTGASYTVEFHQGEHHFNWKNRDLYFSRIAPHPRQLLFLDPDNGFEPEKSCKAKHAAYSEIETILSQLSDDAVLSVFQHARRIAFPNDFARIRERLHSGHATAIYWHSLMFVLISKSEEVIKRVVRVNNAYAEGKKVEVIC